MLDLAWKVDELSRLNTTGRSIVVELQCLLEMLKDDQDANVGSTVDKIGESLTAFLKGNVFFGTLSLVILLLHNRILQTSTYSSYSCSSCPYKPRGQKEEAVCCTNPVNPLLWNGTRKN